MLNTFNCTTLSITNALIHVPVVMYVTWMVCLPRLCERVVGDVSGRVDPHDSPERHQVPPQDGLVVFLTVFRFPESVRISRE